MGAYSVWVRSNRTKIVVDRPIARKNHPKEGGSPLVVRGEPTDAKGPILLPLKPLKIKQGYGGAGEKNPPKRSRLRRE
jgi:hypothetical protein